MHNLPGIPSRARARQLGARFVHGLGPMQAGYWRSLGEAALGWLAIATCAALGARAVPLASDRIVQGLLALLALAWTVLWPAWRLTPAAGRHWWARIGVGLPRLLTLLALLSLAMHLLTPRGAPGTSFAWLADTAAPLVLGALASLAMRALGLAGYALRHWARERISRQLTLSYLMVILLTFIGLVAVGVGVGSLLLIRVLPDARGQAAAVADTVGPAARQSPPDGRQAQGLVEGLMSGRVRPGSFDTPLLLLPWTSINRRTIVLDRDGHVLAWAVSGDVARACPSTTVPPSLLRLIRGQLLAVALAGRTPMIALPTAFACAERRLGPQDLAAVPIHGLGGRIAGVVVVQGLHVTITSSVLLGFAVLGFTFGTALVVAVMVLPTLGISALAGLLFARGLTRRIRAVSRAAEAIAAGDLGQRVPVNTHNEIGRLAEDFNRMTAHLERAIAEFQRAREQAEQALEARQVLVASVSHELRTPIAIVQAHLEMLSQDEIIADPFFMSSNAPERTVPATTLAPLRDEMARLAGLVDDLFSLARRETGALQLQCAPADVAAVAYEVAALLRPLARREGAIALTAEATPGLPPAIVDAERLRQIFANLIRNAIRHTPEGGIIALYAYQDGPWVVAQVADTGEGIAAEHLPHIFDRFYRIDKARGRTSGGAGLGLAIVREFVEGMGGRVTVESAPGEGTCFRVYLAAAPG